MKIDRSAFPVLASMRAFGSFRVPGKTYSAVSPIGDHGRLGLLQNALAEQIRKKRIKTARYPETFRPLWLLLDVDHHFGWRDDTNLARAVIEAENPLEFDRVIVQQTYAEPLIIEFPAPNRWRGTSVHESEARGLSHRLRSYEPAGRANK